MPSLEPQRFQALLDAGNLSQLFIEMGWDHPDLPKQTVTAEGQVFALTPLVHKRGVRVFLCSPDDQRRIPPRNVLLKIEKETVKISHEHLLIFADAAGNMLTWLWVARAPGEPVRPRTHTWHKGTPSEALRQKLEQIVWSLEQEEAITLTDVITGIRNAFDRERISKAFYDQFKRRHEQFAGFIKGLAGKSEREWYASLMLNRLMFIYFIQKKGFLNGDANYLINKLKIVQTQAGKGKFHSFYRAFLYRLFHEGLGQPKVDRSLELTKLIGDIPYLNGSLFSLHELEESHPDIDVPDEAFKKLFAFFDEWDWHLDTRPLRNDKEINPDVLGYIFEKYINQKQMGAYYTKEDITGYISRNTVLPHLLESARKRCKVAFDGESSVWILLKNDPDRYIYPAMKTGVIDAKGELVPESALPDFVQACMKDAKTRMFERRYNLGDAEFFTATGERGTLPTETWREYAERRSRCFDVREKLARGEVKYVDDLITFNLDICQFIQDMIAECSSPDLLRAVWQAIVGRVPEKSTEKFRHGIAILDPTCGSGAFLFAALNILEPLYEACLDRMADFCEDAKKLGRKPEADFVKTLAEAESHPSRSYYVYKSIILHNLFGVDIMPEAVEICKLRLFLKLVSQVDKTADLEPLPDIDFNIRTGNTLVGYATEAQFEASLPLMGVASRDKIKADIADLADCFERFRQQQTVYGGVITTADKRTLRDKLNALSVKLDKYLAASYGKEPKDKKIFEQWRESHQPFHWFAEFYGIMRVGGFDVVIGNPPYLEMREVSYSLINYASIDSKAIHAICIERSCNLLSDSGTISMIVPLSLTSTQRMQNIQRIIERKRSAWFSNFAWRPAKLFDTVNRALTIFVAVPNNKSISNTTKYIKWTSSDRDGLFERITYTEVEQSRRAFWIPKLSNNVEIGILQKLFSSGSTVANYITRSSHHVYYRTDGGLYWKIFTDFAPKFIINGQNSRSSRETSFTTQEAKFATALVGILSSNLFWWYYTIASNLRHLNPIDIHSFPIIHKSLGDKIILALSREYLNDIDNNSTMLTRNQRQTGITQTQSFKVRTSKPILDKIDIELGRLFNFSYEQIDFIINYDIKYRMGGADDEE